MRDTTSHAGVPPAASSVAERFADFYRLEYDRAVRLAWFLTGSQAAAEDVVQDAMTGVYRSFERLESPAAYLRGAVVNRARSRSRNERRQAERVALLERPPAPAAAFEPHLPRSDSGYIMAAWRATRARDHACRPIAGPELSAGSPGRALTSRFAILRQPATRADRLRTLLHNKRAYGPLATMENFSQELYLNQIHLAQTAFGRASTSSLPAT